MSDDFDMDIPSDDPPAPHRANLGSVDDLMSAGTPAAKFESIGDTVQGEIISVDIGQCRDIKTGKPTFWEDGNPKVQALIVLATNQRSEEIDDDNGHRQLYAKRPGAMLKAIVAALGKTKLSESIGGRLAVKYTGDGEATQRGFNPPKQYAAKFVAKNGQATTTTIGAGPATDDAMRNMAMNAAWAKFCKNNPGDVDARNVLWKQCFTDYFPSKTKDQINTIQWRKFADDNFVPGPTELDLPDSAMNDVPDILP